jgi:hypothetical protein
MVESTLDVELQPLDLESEFEDKIVLATPYNVRETQHRQYRLFYEDLTERLEDLDKEVYATYRELNGLETDSEQDRTLINGFCGSDLVLIHPVVSEDVSKIVDTFPSLPKPLISFYQWDHPIDLRITVKLRSDFFLHKEIMYDHEFDGLEQIEEAVNDFYSN